MHTTFTITSLIDSKIQHSNKNGDVDYFLITIGGYS